MTRRALVLAGLVLLLFVPPAATAARSEFFGIVQTATLDNQDIARDGRRPGADEPLRAQVGLGAADADGSYRWDPADAFVGGLASRGIRTVPSVWGNPAWVAGLGLDSPDRRRRGRERVAELPQGAGGALRAGRQPTGPPGTASDSARAPSRCRSSPGRSGTSPT